MRTDVQEEKEIQKEKKIQRCGTKYTMSYSYKKSWLKKHLNGEQIT